MYPIYKSSERARRSIHKVWRKEKQAQTVGIGVDTVYPFEALWIGESFAVPFADIKDRTLQMICQDASMGTKQFELMRHDEHSVYEVFRKDDDEQKGKEAEVRKSWEGLGEIRKSTQYIRDELDDTFWEIPLDLQYLKQLKYPFALLYIGESFFIGYDETNEVTLHQAMKRHSRRTHKQFKLVKHKDKLQYEVARVNDAADSTGNPYY
jgi:hypothetical protein